MLIVRSLRALLAASMVTALAATGCGGGPSETPPELRSRWTTTDPTYSDVWFQIGARELTLHLGPEAGTFTHAIDRIEEQVDGGMRHYVLHYVNGEGVEDAFRIVYQVDNEPLVRFENRRNVHWRQAAP